MTVSPDVNFEELSRCCDEFNGAQCKAVCVEAGMIALRRGAVEIFHEDFMEGLPTFYKQESKKSKQKRRIPWSTLLNILLMAQHGFFFLLKLVWHHIRSHCALQYYSR